MVTPVVLAFGGGPAARVVSPARVIPDAPPAPPGSASATEATKNLIRDTASQRSYQTTVLTRRRDKLIPGNIPGLPRSVYVEDTPPGSPPTTGRPGPEENFDDTDIPPQELPPVYRPPYEVTNVPFPEDVYEPPPDEPPTDEPPPTIFDPPIQDLPAPPINYLPPDVPEGSINMPDTVYYDDANSENGNLPFLSPSDVIQENINIIPPVPDGSVNMPDTIFLGPADGVTYGRPTSGPWDDDEAEMLGERKGTTRGPYGNGRGVKASSGPGILTGNGSINMPDPIFIDW